MPTILIVDDDAALRDGLAAELFTVPGKVALYLREGRLHGVAAFNATRDFGAARRLVASRVALDPLRAADPSCDLRRAVA